MIRSLKSTSRNPCCSGPTPSTYKYRGDNLKPMQVAIPVVVDLLLRLCVNRVLLSVVKTVAIPVVVDLLLRPCIER